MTVYLLYSCKSLERRLDKFDLAIIDQLRKNARCSISAIAQEVSLSRSSVSERIKKLEKNNIIRGYQVLLTESQKEGVSAYFEIQHQCAKCSEIIPHFRQISEVVTCHGISGDMDLLVLVKAESMRRIHEIREQFDAMDEILKIKTHVVLSEWIDNRATS